ncbi:MAG: hypothetical protein E7077_02930 [Bacteroidales bacterium]|jgi:hypothetical protein|nr:hypothetical protein [Bacteroidales bacterium]
MRNFDLTISLPDCAKTIGEASWDVAHVLLTIAKHCKRLKKWEYISYLKKEEKIIDLEKFDCETELAHSISEKFIKEEGKDVRKYNKDVKVVTEDSSDWAGYLYIYMYKESKDVKYKITCNFGCPSSRNGMNIEVPETDENFFEWGPKVMNDLIDYFKPKYAGIYPWYFWKQLKEHQKLTLHPGWILYFPNDFDLPDMSEYEKVEDYKGMGKIYTLKDEKFVSDSRDQMLKWVEAYKKFEVKYAQPASKEEETDCK